MIINSMALYTRVVDMITQGADCTEVVLGNMTKKLLKMFNLHHQGIIIINVIILIIKLLILPIELKGQEDFLTYLDKT